LLPAYWRNLLLLLLLSSGYITRQSTVSALKLVCKKYLAFIGGAEAPVSFV
jgi:hypothetical protein